MTKGSGIAGRIAALLLGLACAWPVAASAQSIAYGATDGPTAEGPPKPDRPRRGKATPRPGVSIEPYIEAAQVATAELSPGNDVLTYTRLAAGVDAGIAGRNNDASLSLRYERYFGWGRKAGDGDIVSGIARGYSTITPGLQIEAGALAARTRVEGNGATVLGPGGDGDDVSQVYSVYAGPSIATQAGDVKIDGHYRIGYTRVESPDAVVTAPGQPHVDVFDDSVAHMAEIHAGTRPGDVLPIGVGAGAGYYREDISNLDQRVEDFQARADVTYPVSHDVALMAGVGYEDVEISSRDALRDASGNPVVGSGGRFVTDKSVPRRIAYDADGIIWDAGVLWRPSRRTSLEAHIGKRYGTTSFLGTFAYAPNPRSSMNVSVYDNIAGFGGQVNRALVALPTDFDATRNPLTGDLAGCVASLEEGSCLSGVLGSVRSSTFRARGVMATYNVKLGRLNGGIGAGYDRRRFVAAPGTVLAESDGVVDENYWLAAYLNARVSPRGTFSTNAYANWFQTGSAFAGDASAYGASAAYGHAITDHLSATAALGIDGVVREDPLEDVWEASALVAMRYTF